MAIQLLVNIDDVLQRSSLSGNTDPDKIIPFIELAQFTQIQKILGDGLYTKMLTIVGDGTITDPGNEWYLRLWEEYLKPTVVYYTLENFLPFHHYQISNAGISIISGENLETVSKGEVDFLTQKYRNSGDSYANSMTAFLCKYSSQFPEHSQNEIEHPDGSSYRVGFYLD